MDFDPNWRITSNSSDPSYSYHQSGSVFIGDYIGIDSSENYAHAIWADTRNEEADAFTAVIVGNVDVASDKFLNSVMTYPKSGLNISQMKN